MALIVGGTTVTGTQTLEASTLTGTASAINGSNITNIAAPSDASILSGVASASAGDVGSYALLKRDNTNGGTLAQNNNVSGGDYRYTGADGTNNGGNPSGTWKIMGYLISGSAGNNVTVGLRVS